MAAWQGHPLQQWCQPRLTGRAWLLPRLLPQLTLLHRPTAQSCPQSMSRQKRRNGRRFLPPSRVQGKQTRHWSMPRCSGNWGRGAESCSGCIRSPSPPRSNFSRVRTRRQCRRTRRSRRRRCKRRRSSYSCMRIRRRWTYKCKRSRKWRFRHRRCRQRFLWRTRRPPRLWERTRRRLVACRQSCRGGRACLIASSTCVRASAPTASAASGTIPTGRARSSMPRASRSDPVKQIAPTS
mmetsp:Transcript_12643/g.31597  ORF Transcript_12643/g.31597 Transcript_12643/m.31597 type:complete len:237 (-) Transcript_12643:156-866(-)